MNIFEVHGPIDGNRVTETAHRKIELQSPADLTYLIANVSRAAHEKIDKHLPPDAAPDGEDAMRRRVEQLVDVYIRNTFSVAKDSISINGMDSREMEAELAKAQDGEEIEPFDTKLAQRLQALSAQIEQQTVQLANLRRTAPAEASQRFQAQYARHAEVHDARQQKDDDERMDQARSTKVGVGDVKRLDEMQSTWKNGAESLQTLKSGLGSTVARMEKAQKVVSVIGER